MKTSLLLAILLLGGLVFSGCRGLGSVPKGWSGGAIADGILFVGSMEGGLVAANATDGSRLWAVSLETGPSAGGFGCAPTSTAVAIYGSPVVAEDLVYVGGYDGKVYAFALDRDEPRWVYPRQGDIGGPIVGGTIVSQGKVYFGTADGKVYALDAAEGYKEEGWPFEIGDKIWSTPAIDGDTLYIGSFDKKLYALNVADGSKKWEFETEGAIVSTPLVHNNTVYIGSFDRYLYALAATDGRLRWKFMAENWFWAKPVVYNDTIYAACLDGKVYALDAESGRKLVEFDLGSPISSSPILVGESIVVATQDGVIYRIDTGNKQKKLVDLKKDDSNEEKKNKRVDAPLAASQGSVYVHTTEDALYAVDVQSGAIREFNIKYSEER
jgi:outer membrane protein assembly factor BamB